MTLSAQAEPFAIDSPSASSLGALGELTLDFALSNALTAQAEPFVDFPATNALSAQDEETLAFLPPQNALTAQSEPMVDFPAANALGALDEFALDIARANALGAVNESTIDMARANALSAEFDVEAVPPLTGVGGPLCDHIVMYAPLISPLDPNAVNPPESAVPVPQRLPSVGTGQGDLSPGTFGTEFRGRSDPGAGAVQEP